MQLGIFFHFLTTHTEGDIDGKIKVGDVPHCAIKLQAETELCQNIFQQIRRDSINHDHTTIEASKPENRHLNRYRDVYPYDHSRVNIWDCDDTDYINASLVQVSEFTLQIF